MHKFMQVILYILTGEMRCSDNIKRGNTLNWRHMDAQYGKSVQMSQKIKMLLWVIR